MQEIKVQELIKLRAAIDVARSCLGNALYAPSHEAYRAKASAAEAELKAKAAPLQAAIDEAQRGCSVRLLTVDALLGAIEEIEKKLSISKKSLEGVALKGVDVHAQAFPAAYTRRGRPESTHFDALYRGSWRITRIYRHRCDKDGGRAILTEAAKTALLERVARL